MRYFLLRLMLATLLVASTVRAGIPVIDGSNLTQNIMTAMESVAQTLKQVQQYATQIQQYQTQLLQYENMIKNTLAPAAYVWNQAQSTISLLRGATDILHQFKTSAGGLDAYLNNFQDLHYYRNSPCYSATGCSAEEMARMNSDANAAASEAMKKANDSIWKGLDKQQDALQADAARLEQLQSNAQTAEGQMQAIGYAAQIAGEQANQLMQIRQLLIAQQNAIAAKMQADADKEARQQAGDEQFRRGRYNVSSGKSW